MNTASFSTEKLYFLASVPELRTVPARVHGSSDPGEGSWTISGVGAVRPACMGLGGLADNRPVLRICPECGHHNESVRTCTGHQLPAPRTCEVCDAALVPVRRGNPDRHQARLGFGGA